MAKKESEEVRKARYGLKQIRKENWSLFLKITLHFIIIAAIVMATYYFFIGMENIEALIEDIKGLFK